MTLEKWLDVVFCFAYWMLMPYLAFTFFLIIPTLKEIKGKENDWHKFMVNIGKTILCIDGFILAISLIVAICFPTVMSFRTLHHVSIIGLYSFIFGISFIDAFTPNESNKEIAEYESAH